MSSTTEQNIPPADTAVPREDVDASNMAVIARQAIVDHNRAVYGYELFDRSTASDAHTAASDAALLFNALSYAGTEALVGKKTVFINCTHELGGRPPGTDPPRKGGAGSAPTARHRNAGRNRPARARAAGSCANAVFAWR